MPLAGKTVATASGFPTFPSTKDDEANVGFNAAIFGPPGGGKTTFATSIKHARPDEKVLLFDLDLGRESILDVDVDYLDNTDWTTLRQYLDLALELAAKGEFPYQTYIWDSLSSLYYEHIFPHAEKKMGSGKDGRQYYYEAQKLLGRFVRDAKILSSYGVNTIFTGHEVEQQDGEIITVRLALPQGIRNDILLTVNHVGYLTRKANSEVRELHMTPPRKVRGPKLRQTRSGKQAPLVYEDPTMGKLLEALHKEQ